MLHRHFDIDNNQILVEFNNITLPWVGSWQSYGKYKGLSTTAWKLVVKEGPDGKEFAWMPYEFSYDPAYLQTDTDTVAPMASVDLNDTKFQAFLAEYSAAIREAGLDQVVGLRVWPGKDFRGGLERTEGKANIWLVPGQVRIHTV
jgi:hypothetical protein